MPRSPRQQKVYHLEKAILALGKAYQRVTTVDASLGEADLELWSAVHQAKEAIETATARVLDAKQVMTTASDEA